jgi:hypothetical protein
MLWASPWPERIGSILAVLGAILGVLPGFHPATWQGSGSDFKTLYAAARCFARATDPYSLANISTIFRSNHVIEPANWYGHAPVYPPFTLAILSPLTALPMVPAIYLWMAITGIALAAAAYALTQAAGEIYGLGRPWRFALIALFAASPLLSFGVEMCNVSPLVGSLCILAVTKRAHLWSALALGLALLLKPHITIWVVFALLVTRVRRDRALAYGGLAVATAASLLVAAWMAAHHTLTADLLAYRGIVHSEIASGSMSPSNHELVAVAAQITSLGSLLGYAVHGTLLSILTAVGLTAAGAATIILSLRIRGQADAARINRVALWCAFGLIATYHRAHDGLVLVMILPYLLARLQKNARDLTPWSFVGLSVVMSFGPRWETSHWLATFPGLWHVATFMLYRQSPLAAVLILLLLLFDAARSAAPAEVRANSRARTTSLAAAA